MQEDEDGAPGHFAFTIFNFNWWMVKVSCPEFTPEGYSPSSGEDQIPPEIFQKLKFVLCSRKNPYGIIILTIALAMTNPPPFSAFTRSMNDPFYNRAGEARLHLKTTPPLRGGALNVVVPPLPWTTSTMECHCQRRKATTCGTLWESGIGSSMEGI